MAQSRPAFVLPTEMQPGDANLRTQIGMVWGQRGCGKNTLLVSESKKSLTMSTHEGTGHIKCYAAPVGNIEDVYGFLKACRDADDRFDTVIIDEIDDVYRWLLSAAVKDRMGPKASLVTVSSDDRPTYYQLANEKFEGLLRGLRTLPQSVRLTSGQRKDDPPEKMDKRKKRGRDADRTILSCGLSASARRILQKHLDFIWRIHFDPEVPGRRLLRLVAYEDDRLRVECKSRLPSSAAGTLPTHSIPLTDDDGNALGWDHIQNVYDRAMRGEEIPE